MTQKAALKINVLIIYYQDDQLVLQSYFQLENSGMVSKD